MAGSDEIAAKVNKAMTTERMINDTHCKAHRAQTEQLRWLIRAIVTVGIATIAAGAGWIFTISGNARALQERNVAQAAQIAALEKRIDREVTEIKDAILRTENNVKDSNERMEARFRRLNERLDVALTSGRPPLP